MLYCIADILADNSLQKNCYTAIIVLILHVQFYFQGRNKKLDPATSQQKWKRNKKTNKYAYFLLKIQTFHKLSMKILLLKITNYLIASHISWIAMVCIGLLFMYGKILLSKCNTTEFMQQVFVRYFPKCSTDSTFCILPFPGKTTILFFTCLKNGLSQTYISICTMRQFLPSLSTNILASLDLHILHCFYYLQS